jgi:hypothetical protein
MTASRCEGKPAAVRRNQPTDRFDTGGASAPGLG